MTDSQVSVVLLFPELLGTYGDRGNALVLRRRCQLRGIAVELIDVGVRDALPEAADIYLLGGGEDAPQLTALDILRTSGVLTRAVDRGAVLLAVCAGFQIVGRELPDRSGTAIEGLGLVDVTTVRAPKRLVGEVRVRDDVLGTGWIVGFENHQGVTTPGAGTPALGARIPASGFPTDGVVSEHIVGTYLHGPVLARNPALADRLLEWVVGDLSPLADAEADALHAERLAAIKQ